MKTYAIILAGGSGKRFGGDIPKQYLELQSIPVIIYSAITFNSIKEVDSIIVICSENFIDEVKNLFNKYQINKFTHICKGGNTRQESSYNAINCMNFEDDDIILLHDAARPLVKKQTVIDNINNTKKYGCSGTYITATDTIAVYKNDFISEIPDRNNMLLAQTPQGFKYSIIQNCHKRAILENLEVTDDVSLVKQYGHDVYVTQGNIENIKITNIVDLKICEMFLNK